ncbi:MAG: flagellar motor switch protein FliN [Phycisphaerae bacterium]|nr:flagellar motor switch protein FliN [Phycisphaerae bacterium]
MAKEDQPPEDSGELTQEQIDAAFGGGGAEDAPDPAASTSFSQDDIDAMLDAGNADPQPQSAPVPAEAPAPAPADEGELAQADIDAMLTGGGSAGDDTLSDSMLTQADINAALGGGGTGASEESSSGGAMTQADIDAAMADASAGDTPQDQPPVDDRVDATGRPFDAAAAAMAAAIEEEKAAAAAPPPPPPPDTSPVELPSFDSDEDGEDTNNIMLIQDVELRVKIELGRTRMLVEDVLALATGSVVELDKLAGDPVDVFVNNRLIARGEVLVLNDNFCVRISEIVSNADARQVG